MNLESIILPPGVKEHGVLRIDSSGLLKVHECFREAWYLLAHRRELDALQWDLFTGQVLHEAVDLRQKGATIQEQEAAIERAFEGVTIPEDEYRTPGRLKEVAGLYMKEFEKEPFEVVASELSREKELGLLSLSGGFPVKVLWQGKTDGIWRQGNKLCIKDTKMTKEATQEQKYNEYRMSPQLKMYCWLFSGEEFGEIRDVVVDLVIVRKPVARVTAATKPRTEFFRINISFTDEEIEECKRGVLGTLQAWLDCCSVPDVEPPMTGAPRACVWPKKCPYFGVCSQKSHKDRMNWLYSGQYRDYEWNPMSK